MLRDMLWDEGHRIGRKHVATLMRKMGIEALYRKPNISRRDGAQAVYPYLHAYGSVSEVKAGLGRYLTFYNKRRPHRTIDGQTPNAIYFQHLPALQQAA